MLKLAITEKELEFAVELDWSRLTWGDLLEFQKAAGDEERSRLMGDLIERLSGLELAQMPALVVTELGQRVVARLSGSAKSGN